MRKTHGLGGKEKLYSVWSNMRNRCNNPRCKDYPYYGGKGVKVTPEWDDYATFRDWAYSNGYKEGAGVSIDRINVDGIYSPENCRWATREQQANNMSSNHLITYAGETHTISEWATIIGLSSRTLETRIRAYGWDYERALTTPLNNNRVKYDYLGELHTLSEWAKIFNINYNTLYNRVKIYGWDIAKAIETTPKVGGHYE